MKEETPQWEIRFDNEFAIQDDVWGKAKYGESTIYPPSKVKALIKSTLEEVIEKIHECCDGECYHDDCCGKLSCVKAQLRKEFL